MSVCGGVAAGGGSPALSANYARHALTARIQLINFSLRGAAAREHGYLPSAQVTKLFMRNTFDQVICFGIWFLVIM